MYHENQLSMSVVDLWLKSSVSWSRILVGLSCMFSITSIMHGRMKLMWHVFHAIIRNMHGGGCVGRSSLGLV